MIVTIEDLFGQVPMKLHGNKWVPARPINYQFRRFTERLREAWMVFTGRADPFVWPEDMVDAEVYNEASDEPMLIRNWEELSKVPPSATHYITVNLSNGNGWIMEKDPKRESLGYYLTTHTFYGPSRERSTEELRKRGFNVTLDDWDSPAPNDSRPTEVELRDAINLIRSEAVKRGVRFTFTEIVSTDTPDDTGSRVSQEVIEVNPQTLTFHFPE